PRKTFPRAIIISGLSIAAVYLTGTISLLWALPQSQVSIISGVNMAITKAGAQHGMPWLGPPIALLMTLAGLGGGGPLPIPAAPRLRRRPRLLSPADLRADAPAVEDALVRDALPGGLLGALHRGRAVGRHGQGGVPEARQRDADRLLPSLPLHVCVRDPPSRG